MRVGYITCVIALACAQECEQVCETDFFLVRDVLAIHPVWMQLKRGLAKTFIWHSSFVHVGRDIPI